MVSKVTTISLNNGIRMPVVGLGTWKSQKGEAKAAVRAAIEAGYRAIDCAHVYQNESEIGDTLAEIFAEGTVKREDLFITSKLWNTFHRPDLVRPALQTTLKNLKLNYLDLYLIHWPTGLKEGDELFPTDSDGQHSASSVDYVDTWKELEKAVDDGLVRSIGISNFNKSQTERVLSVARIKPVVNQIEVHPYLNQRRLIKYLESVGIKTTAYAPLGSPTRPWLTEKDTSLLDDPVITKIAKKYNKSPAQVLIRYHVDNNVTVIPKSVTKARIIDNLNVFDFQLTTDELNKLNQLDKGRSGRAFVIEQTTKHAHYPFHDEF